MNDKIAQILFGSNVNPVLVTVYNILSETCDIEPVMVRKRFREILNRQDVMDSRNDNRIYALVIDAIFMRFPGHPHHLADELLVYYKEHPPRVPKAPLGLVFGLLRAVKRLDDGLQDPWTVSLLDDHLVPKVCKTLVELCFEETDFDVETDHLSKQKSWLSEMVAYFARPKEKGRIGHRLAQVVDMLSDIKQMISDGKSLSPFGEVLIDEFCYKTFLDLSLKGRLTAIVQLYGYLTTPAPAASPVESDSAVKPRESAAFEG